MTRKAQRSLVISAGHAGTLGASNAGTCATAVLTPAVPAKRAVEPFIAGARAVAYTRSQRDASDAPLGAGALARRSAALGIVTTFMGDARLAPCRAVLKGDELVPTADAHPRAGPRAVEIGRGLEANLRAIADQATPNVVAVGDGRQARPNIKRLSFCELARLDRAVKNAKGPGDACRELLRADRRLASPKPRAGALCLKLRFARRKGTRARRTKDRNHRVGLACRGRLVAPGPKIVGRMKDIDAGDKSQRRRRQAQSSPTCGRQNA